MRALYYSKEIRNIIKHSSNKGKIKQSSIIIKDIKNLLSFFKVEDIEISNEIVKEELIYFSKTEKIKATLKSFESEAPSLILWHSSFLVSLFRLLNNPISSEISKLSINFALRLQNRKTINLISSLGLNKGFDKILNTQIKIKAKERNVSFFRMQHDQLESPHKYVNSNDLIIMEKFYEFEKLFPLFVIPDDLRVLPLAFELITKFKLIPWDAYEISYGVLYKVNSIVSVNCSLAKIPGIHLYLNEVSI